MLPYVATRLGGNPLNQPKPSLIQVLEMGRKGQHVLFEPEDIRAAFESVPTVAQIREFDECQRYERGLSLVVRMGELPEQRRFLRGLPQAIRQDVCRFYFELLEAFDKKALIPSVTH